MVPTVKQKSLWGQTELAQSQHSDLGQSRFLANLTAPSSHHHKRDYVVLAQGVSAVPFSSSPVNPSSPR